MVVGRWIGELGSAIPKNTAISDPVPVARIAWRGSLARTRRSDWSLHYTRERKLVRGFWNSVKRSTTQHSTSQTLQGQKVKGQDKTGHAGPIANGSPAKKFGDLIILEFLYFYISIFRISFIFNLCSLRIFFLQSLCLYDEKYRPRSTEI